MSVRPIITVDFPEITISTYEFGMSDAQKEEFLQALWSIVVTFFELGFGVHPLQESAEKIPATPLCAPRLRQSKTEGI